MDKAATMSLLLLPALTGPVKRSSWWAAYRSTFEIILQRLKPSDGTSVARLDVAVVLTSASSPSTSRTSFFPEFQDLLREVYSLICISANRGKVDLDFPGGIDVRVFLLDCRPSYSTRDLESQRPFSGPIVDVDTFVRAERVYETIYSVESESAEEILKNLLQLWRQNVATPDVQQLPCGPFLNNTMEASKMSREEKVSHHHRNVAVGGTFDHIHIGHKVLLAATVYAADPGAPGPTGQPRSITVGITGDELLVNKKHGSLVESWEERQQRTAEFIESILLFHPDVPSVRSVELLDQPGPNGKIVKITYGGDVTIDYTRISDPFGPTITKEAITALIISAETRAGGKAVNDKRIEKGWAPLDVFEIDVLDAEVQDDYGGPAGETPNFANKISSTDIRKRLEAKTKSSGSNL